MTEPRKARPVSGEIMAAEGRDTTAQPSRTELADIVDADYEIVTARRDESPEPSHGFSPQPAAPEGMGMLRSSTRQIAGCGRGGPIFWIAGISLAAMAFWASGGHTVVRAAAFPLAWQAPTLRIAEVNSRVDSSGRKPVLLIDGSARNEGPKAAVLPPIDIIVAANDGKILRYRLGTAAAHVAPGARWDFSSRLDVPMNGVKTVTVAFSE